MGNILRKAATRKKEHSHAPRNARSDYKGWPVCQTSEEIKIVVCGAGGVGKSAFTIQFVSNHFVEEYDPTIEDSYRKQMLVDGTMAMMQILDTAGQEEFSAMQDQWFRSGDAFVILYSITDRTTFEEVRKFFHKILQAKDSGAPGPMILVGNKADLEAQRKVPREEGQDLARSLGIPFIEASAKTRLNLEESFFSVVRDTRRAKGPTAVRQVMK